MTTASAVSARLRRLGFNPVATRNREGIRVTGCWNSKAAKYDHQVRVTADAARLSTDAEAALKEAGVRTERVNAEVFYVMEG